MKKRVFVCSPLRGDLQKNIEALYRYCKWASDRGVAPFGPHGFYTAFLDDNDPKDRENGIDSGISFLSVCNEVWVFVVDGRLSQGMTKEILFAIAAGIPVKYFAVKGNEYIHLSHCAEDEIPKRYSLISTEKAVDEAQQAFAMVENALKGGSSYGDIAGGLDRYLGTEMEDRDLDAEMAWEGGVQDSED